MQQAPQTFFIRTYGCQMNELDSDVMKGLLLKRGLTQVDTEQQADLLLFNTCSIRDLAERKVMGKLGRLGKQKKTKIIGLTGCMATAKKESLFQKLPHIDFVLGPNNIHDLNHVLDEVVHYGKQSLKTEDHFYEDIDFRVTHRSSSIKAYVNIIRGCNKFCTYCVVPYTRGKEVSRPHIDILDECKQLADQGVKELTLLGQNVNSYGKDRSDEILFHDLLHQIDKIDGIERIRFLTSHPIDITKNLMEAIRDLPSLCEFVHFPLQAGSSRILQKMHRIYTKEQYFEKVALLKELVPNVTLGTDIIVGFPTETDAEFEETYKAMEEIRFHVGYLYTYSPRKGTPAMRWKDDIPEEIKNERLQRLLSLQEKINAEQRSALIGSTVEVLVDRRTKDGKKLRGRSRCWQKTLFEGPDELIGTTQKIEVTGFSGNCLFGQLAPRLSLV